MLLVGAGLLLASFYRLQRVETGYRSDGVLSAQIYGNFSRYPNMNELRKLYLPVLERLQTAPGVSAAADDQRGAARRRRPGHAPVSTSKAASATTPSAGPTADVRVASPQYFATIGVPLVSGRAFNDLDTEESMRVVVINQAMTRYWEGADPVGSRIALPAADAAGSAPGTAAGMVHHRRGGRRRAPVRPRAGDGGAGLRAADAVAVRLCRPGAGAHRRRSRGLRHDAARRRPRGRSEPAGRRRADAGRSCDPRRWRRRA